MKNKDKRFIFFLVFLLLGAAITIQIKSTVYTNKKQSANSLNIEKLKTQIEKETKISELFRQSIKENEQKKESYLKTSANDKEYPELKKQLDELKLLAGMTDVKGAGVIIKLNDALIKGDGLISDYILHNTDIAMVVNELRAAGAQAISINNERIIATSGFICTGPTIKINRNRYAVPFEIKAIGNPDEIIKQLEESETVMLLKNDNIRVDITKDGEVHIPKYSNNLDDLISGLEVLNNENQ
ncbi:MAG: DUF881 domain-containing protein [Clostridia bacterium]|nr:DUF881 domain-containing protein [Clostridia bacterium]